MLLHAYDYTTLLLIRHKHGIRSYYVRIAPDSFIGDALPVGHHTHLAQLALVLARRCLAVLCVKKLDIFEPSQNQFPLLRSVQHSHLEHEASQNPLDELLIKTGFDRLW